MQVQQVNHDRPRAASLDAASSVTSLTNRRWSERAPSIDVDSWRSGACFPWDSFNRYGVYLISWVDPDPFAASTPPFSPPPRYPHRQLNFDRGAKSKPPTTSSKKSSMRPISSSSDSIFTRGKNRLFRRSSSQNSSVDYEHEGPQSSLPADVIDIGRGPSTTVTNHLKDQNDMELDKLRDDAARSIGLTPQPPGGVDPVSHFAHVCRKYAISDRSSRKPASTKMSG